MTYAYVLTQRVSAVAASAFSISTIRVDFILFKQTYSLQRATLTLSLSESANEAATDGATAL